MARSNRTTSSSTTSGADHAAAPSSKKLASSRAAPNTLAPSPKVVSWIDRLVTRLTTEAPWIYRDANVRSDEPARAPSAPSGRAVNSRPALDTQTVPEEVRERFVRVGNDFHFPNGQMAFRDRGKKLVSQS